MTKSFRFIVVAIAVIMAIFASAPTNAAGIEIAGEVTYRERIALPPEAVLKIELVDVSLSGSPARIGADAVIDGPGQVPLQFILSFDSDVLIDGHKYALVASISAGEHLWFENATPYALDPLAPVSPVLVIVNFVGELIDPNAPVIEPEPEIPVVEEEVELEVTAEIFDTIWVVTDLNGMTPGDAQQSTLSITTDRRAGGIGGCNNYFAEAYFDGPALSFGDIVSTRMACGDAAMDQESAFFAALTSVRGYELDGDLFLLDIDGNTVLRLAHVDVN